MKPSFADFLNEVDGLIRTAQGNVARKKLKAISPKKIPPSELWKVAALARRADCPEVSIQILRPVVRPIKKVGPSPQEQDYTEYGAGLLRLGAVEEASELLKKVNTKKCPEALLFLAMLRIKEWDYVPAIELIRKYLEVDLAPYARTVAEMNLAACLTYEGHHGEAKEMLEALIAKYENDEKNLLLHAHAIRLMGILEIQRRRLQAALGYFFQAESLLAPVGGFEHFFARKWVAITEFLIRPSHQDGLLAMEHEAIKRQHWETIRDIYFHRAFALKEMKTIETLYVGTPFPAFQKRLRKNFPDIKVRNPYPYQLGGEGKGVTLDLEAVESFKTPLKRGQTIHRLLTTLLSDFYRGFSPASIFERIFPGEYYHPKISDYRVHQAMKRLRKWFKANQLPLKVEANKNSFRIVSDSPCTVLLNSERKAAGSSEYKLGFLSAKLKGEFTANEVAKALNVTQRSANLYIKEALEAGLIQKLGSGSKTRYRFQL